jgi:hypothetical protein
MDEATSNWLITLGISDQFSGMQFGVGSKKGYKMFRIDSKSG